MTTLLLIRHGDNDMVIDRLAGRIPEVHLNEHGKQQADQLIMRLAETPIHGIYSSPLERAVETAQPLANVRGLPVNLSQGLLELDYGEWQGCTYKSLMRLKLWKTILNEPEKMRFPGGESFTEVQQRACDEIGRIAAQHKKNDIVVCFTHGDIIRLALTHFLGMPLVGFHRFVIHTASITVLFFNKELPPFLVHFNYSGTLGFKPEI